MPDSKEKRKKKDIYDAKITADYTAYKYLVPEQQEDIIAATEAVAHYQDPHFLGFGKRRTSKRKTGRKVGGKVGRKRRTSKTKKHSFGSSELNSNFKRFLIIATIMLARSVIKKNPNSVNSDIKNIEYGALNYLTITSLLELIEHLFGAQVRDKVVLGYIVISIGLDMSELI
jgi:hypothetical protein